MNTSAFARLEDVIQSAQFPDADVLLRKGRHIHHEDGDLYAFVRDAEEHLEKLYQRFGCELVHMADGYYYLLPTGEHLARRQLSVGEMLVGQTLALLARDPELVQTAGIVPRVRILERLRQLVGSEELVRLLNPRKKKRDDRTGEQSVRDRVAEAIRELARLGFVSEEEGERVRVRPAIHRFADAVRGQGDPAAGLERLIRSGRAAMPDTADEQNEEGEP